MTGPVSLRRSNGLRAGDIGGGTRNTKTMPKLTRIYTRAGDRGMTGLVGGRRVKKTAPRIATYGTLDELSSAIGVTRTALRPLLQSHTRAARLDGWLAWTQDVLFNLGTDLATLAPDRREGLPRVEAADALALERAIDQAQCDLPPLATFIHPGGSLAGAYLHVARTICRRAERLVVALIDEENDVSPEALPYLNRLSDALFVWARWINDALHDTEHLWNPATRPPE
ncbi:MAG: cob(I)yrinic acid a,c-diamide adenosyltransferase [Candidatus Cybelea sp.]